jgi:hypothetical protein
MDNPPALTQSAFVFSAGKDEIDPSPNEEVEKISTSSKMKGPPRKKSKKNQLKNARERANEINRNAVEKLKDIHRMKEGVEKEKRTSNLMKLGRKIHFLEQGAYEQEASNE